MKIWVGFSVLCLLGATRWLLPEAEPEASDTGSFTLMLGALFAMVFACGLAWRRLGSPVPGSSDRGVFAGGALLLVGLNLPVWIRPQGLSASNVTLALALTPVVIAVAGQAFDDQNHEDLTGKLWPGLVLLAGLLLILPEPRLRNWRVMLLLAAMPLLTGVGAALLSRTSVNQGRVHALALTGAFAAGLLGWALQGIPWPTAPFAGASSLIWKAAWEGASLLLSFTVLLQIGAFRWSAVFAIVPLLVVAESVMLAGVVPASRLWLAMALLLVSGIFLLRPPTSSKVAEGGFTP